MVWILSIWKLLPFSSRTLSYIFPLKIYSIPFSLLSFFRTPFCLWYWTTGFDFFFSLCFLICPLVLFAYWCCSLEDFFDFIFNFSIGFLNFAIIFNTSTQFFNFNFSLFSWSFFFLCVLEAFLKSLMVLLYLGVRYWKSE